MKEGRPVSNISTGKRSAAKPMHSWEGNITIYIDEIGVNTKNLIGSIQDGDNWRALVNTILNVQVLNPWR